MPAMNASHSASRISTCLGGTAANVAVLLARFGVPVSCIYPAFAADASNRLAGLLQREIDKANAEGGLITFIPIDCGSYEPQIAFVGVDDTADKNRAFVFFAPDEHENFWKQLELQLQSEPGFDQIAALNAPPQTKPRVLVVSSIGGAIYPASALASMVSVLQQYRKYNPRGRIFGDVVNSTRLSDDKWRGEMNQLDAWRCMDYFAPNLEEAISLASDGFTVDTPGEGEIAEMLHRRGVRNLFVKRGPYGVYCSESRKGRVTEVAAIDVEQIGGRTDLTVADEIVDSCGAGDAWVAGFVAAKAYGHENPQAVEAANVVSYLSLREIGGSSLRVTWPDVEQLRTCLYMRD